MATVVNSCIFVDKDLCFTKFIYHDHDIFFLILGHRLSSGGCKVQGVPECLQLLVCVGNEQNLRQTIRYEPDV